MLNHHAAQDQHISRLLITELAVAYRNEECSDGVVGKGLLVGDADFERPEQL